MARLRNKLDRDAPGFFILKQCAPLGRADLLCHRGYGGARLFDPPMRRGVVARLSRRNVGIVTF